MDKLKNRVLRYYLEIVSPVHVGSGARLQPGVDFFSAGGKTWLIDQQALAEILKDNPLALEDFADPEKKPNIHELATRYKFPERVAPVCYRGKVTAQDMFEFVRTGTGLPYLPGSSIKGALRTVILWKLSQAKEWQADRDQRLERILQAPSERSAGNVIVEKAFNIAAQHNRRPNDANRDLMRALHVGDAHFKPEEVELADARIFNVLDENRAGWKNLSPRRGQNPNEAEAHKATQLAAEALRIGAVAEVEISFDEFLLKSSFAKKEARFAEHAGLFETLPEICNHCAARQIDKQQRFFAKYNLTALANFYSEKLGTLRASLGPQDFLLRLAWGSGWQSMTGELFEEANDMEKIRRRFDLGKFTTAGLPNECPNCHSTQIDIDKYNKASGFCFHCKKSFPAPNVKKVMFPIFPKTRKIALEADQPCYPFGWVVFRHEQPQKKTLEPFPYSTPPPYKPERPTQAPPLPPRIQEPPLPPPPPARTTSTTAIRGGDKIRAKVIQTVGKDRYEVELIEKDSGRKLTCSTMLSLNAGSLIKVRVETVVDNGARVAKIAFDKLIVAG